MRLIGAGIECVVAPMGTALTEDQAQMIRRYTDRVYLLYDSDKAGLKAAGPAMTIYTAMDDVSFNFQAAIPVAAPPKGAPKGAPTGDILSGTSPAGKALKFVHRGSFDAMTQTYDTISHHVDEKQISTQELLIEEYITDLVTAPADKLVINIFVPLN